MSLLRQAEQCILNQKAHASLNAFISPFYKQKSSRWLDRLHQAAERAQNGKRSSPVDGSLIAIKDNICTNDYPTTCASGILKDFTSPYNATVVQKLEDAGAIVAGKTNLDEFGMGSHSTHSFFGPVINQDASNGDEFSAGGSSGGSAIAAATGQCLAALGTDTGGSVRLPAAYTGIVGFKPSYGLISRWGVVAYANSLDTVGVLARNIQTVRDIYSILNHFDHLDPTSLSPSSRLRIKQHSAQETRQTLRIGVPLEYNIHELSPPVLKAWQITLQSLNEQGHTIHPVSLPRTRQALSAYYVLAPAEASSNLAKYDGIRYGSRAQGSSDAEGGYLYAKTRGEAFGSEVKRRIILGAFSLSAEAMDNYFIQAQKVRRMVQTDFDNVFRMANPLLENDGPSEDGGVDVLVCPTAPTTAPTLKALAGKEPVDAYMNDVLTVPASLAGLPAVSVPVHSSGDGKVGMQVIGQFGDDELVLSVGEIVEGLTVPR